MKKTIMNIRTMAALLIASAAFTACSNEDGAVIGEQPAATQTPQVYTLTLQAANATGAQHRALALDGTKLVAKWAAGDELTVIKVFPSPQDLGGTLTASNVSADGKTCTFSGTLTGDIAVDDQLALHYHAISGTQDGTLESAAANDHAVAIVTVASAHEGNITISESKASFNTTTAVLKLTLKDGSANALNATSLKMTVDGTDFFTASPTAATYTANGNGVLYFAVPEQFDAAAIIAQEKSGGSPTPMLIDTWMTNLNTYDVTFTATVGSDTYTATKTGYKLAGGKYYATELTMAKAGPTAYTLTESTVGMIVGSDGKAYAAADKDNLPTGVTAVAIVAYKGSETGETSPYNHGLAIAMKDAAAGGKVKWSSSDNDESLDNFTDTNPAVTTAQSGLSNSRTSGFDNESNYPAFYAALHNTITVSDGISAAAPASGTSGWFLPSLYQWNKIVQGLSGKTADLSDGGNANANYTASSLNPNIEAAGGTGLQSGAYWPSTEYSNPSAWYFYTGNGSVGYRNKTGESYVRAVFAF